MFYFKGGGYNILSNMAAYAVEWRGQVWPTVEHAYQVAKFTDTTIISQITKARSPYEAKMLATKHAQKIRPDWHKENLQIMKELLQAKVAQHEHVRRKLLESGGAELVEDTDDPFWGRGVDGSGDNQLGKLWMQIRDELSR